MVWYNENNFSKCFSKCLLIKVPMMCIPEFKLMLTAHSLIAIDRSDCPVNEAKFEKNIPTGHNCIAIYWKKKQTIEYNLVPPVSAHATNMDFSVNITKLILDNDSTDQTNMNLTRIYWKENQEVDAI